MRAIHERHKESQQSLLIPTYNKGCDRTVQSLTPRLTDTTSHVISQGMGQITGIKTKKCA